MANNDNNNKPRKTWIMYKKAPPKQTNNFICADGQKFMTADGEEFLVKE